MKNLNFSREAETGCLSAGIIELLGSDRLLLTLGQLRRD
jgi:hypothetical protein